MLPVGKLPLDLLAKIIAKAPSSGDRVLLGPGIGLDCAIIDLGATCLVFKTDPITFTSEQLGWYAVHVAVNDIATTGALPKWMLLTTLLPDKRTTAELVENLSEQVFEVCRTLDIAFIGGHTEITHGLDRPILVTTLIGEVNRDELITPRGAQPGDAVILTKGVPIEGTAILAREFPELLSATLTQEELREAQNYLFYPGISVYQDALTAISAGKVTAMHDPTEGGVANALWELAEACQCTIEIDRDKIFVSDLSRKVCSTFKLNPLGTIASGALLITTTSTSFPSVLTALSKKGISSAVIGQVKAGPAKVIEVRGSSKGQFVRFYNDEIGRVYSRR